MIARPLTNLLKANVDFVFDEKEKDTFLQLKDILIERPVLNLNRVNAETELYTDACMYGYGTILLQRGHDDNALHSVYYASGKNHACRTKLY